MNTLMKAWMILGFAAGLAFAQEGELDEPSTPEAPAPEAAVAPTLGFRISAIILQPDNPRIGIAYRETGANYLLGLGESTPEGLRLEAVEYDQEQARFVKGGLTYVAKLEQDAELRLATLPQALAPPEDRAGPPSTEPSKPSEPDSARTVLTSKDGRRIELAFLSNDHMTIKEGAQTFAVPRLMAERILGMNHLSDDEKLHMLLSFPLLVEIKEGDDPAQKMQEQQKKIMGEPPTEPPPSGPPDFTPPAPPQ